MAYTISKSQKDLVASLIQGGVLKTPLIMEAFKAVDRKDFVLQPFADEAYENSPISIGHGQTISQPWTVAFMLELLNPQPGQIILDIGSGSGWTTALLAHAATNAKKNPVGRVVGIELVPELRILGEKNCAKYNFVESGIVEFHCQDGALGFQAKAPFDRILCSASLPTRELPESWKRQLKVGGRIVAPIGNSIFVFDKVNENDFIEREYEGFAFVPFVNNK